MTEIPFYVFFSFLAGGGGCRWRSEAVVAGGGGGRWWSMVAGGGGGRWLWWWPEVVVHIRMMDKFVKKKIKFCSNEILANLDGMINSLIHGI